VDVAGVVVDGVLVRVVEAVIVVGEVLVVVNVELVAVLLVVVVVAVIVVLVHDAATSDKAINIEHSPMHHLIFPGNLFFICSPFSLLRININRKGRHQRRRPIETLYKQSLLSKHGRRHYL